MSAYEQWVEAYVTRHPNRFVRGRCAEATVEMIKAFPELRRACGFVTVQWGRDQHWWCVAPDGSVVDPTAEQFGAMGVFEYEEIDTSNPEHVARIPIAKCMECSGAVYEHSASVLFCSDECATACAAAMMAPPPKMSES